MSEDYEEDYLIEDIDVFAEFLRSQYVKVYTAYQPEISKNPTEQEKFNYDVREQIKDIMQQCELDQLITISQIAEIITDDPNVEKIDQGFLVNTDSVVELTQKIEIAIFQSAFSKLSAQDKLNCGWNPETNMMEFWPK